MLMDAVSILVEYFFCLIFVYILQPNFACTYTYMIHYKHKKFIHYTYLVHMQQRLSTTHSCILYITLKCIYVLNIVFEPV